MGWLPIVVIFVTILHLLLENLMLYTYLYFAMPYLAWIWVAAFLGMIGMMVWPIVSNLDIKLQTWPIDDEED